MKRVLIEQYDTYDDRATGAQFRPVLDRRTGLFSGVAEVSDETAKALAARVATVDVAGERRKRFRVLNEAEWRAMTSAAPAPVRTKPAQGGPLTEAAGGMEPPAPPASK